MAGTGCGGESSCSAERTFPCKRGQAGKPGLSGMVRSVHKKRGGVYPMDTTSPENGALNAPSICVAL